MRTWQIGVNPETAQEEIIAGPSVRNDQFEVAVIELEPVLDLLERWFDNRTENSSSQALDTEVLLKAHNRLTAQNEKEVAP